jgi:3-oxoacyl-[acyl-carrier protein] reductase
MGYLEDRAQLEGKRALIVGAGGLGEACAVDLAAAGVRVALCDRSEEALASTARRVSDGGGIVACQGVFDARDPEALTAFFATCDEHFDGELDVLCNVVGGTFRHPFDESKPKGWETLMRTNFTWLLTAIQLAIPRMRAAGKGSIINFTSIEAHRAAPGFVVYGAMKAAVASLTASLAVELGVENIRVNAIAPDYTPTPNALAAEAASPLGSPDERGAALRAEIGLAMGRDGTYEDVGGAVLFLASELSSYVTGTTIHPDGGSFAAKGWNRWPGQGFTNLPPRAVVDMYLADTTTAGN